MMNLLWKDYRQNRALLLAVAILGFGPYVFAGSAVLIERLLDPPATYVWVGAIFTASCVSMALSILLAAFLGGNAIAGERADRSAEFAALLPLPRGRSVASRALVTFVPALVLWLIGSLALAGVFWKISKAPHVQFDTSGVPAGILCTFLGVLLLFGLGWLYSSLLRNPAIAAAAAVGTAVTLGVATLSLMSLVPPGPLEKRIVVTLICTAAGLAVLSFCTGVLLTLRRQEP